MKADVHDGDFLGWASADVRVGAKCYNGDLMATRRRRRLVY